jgi:hypothetical protein
MRKQLVFILMVVGFSVFGKTDSTLVLKGVIFDSDSLQPISAVHVVNKNQTIGTISNHRGAFAIDARVGDTIVFSNISFQYYYHYVTWADTAKYLKILMITRDFMLDEVSIFTYELTTNAEKPIKMGSPMIPRSQDIPDPQPMEASFASPVDLIYSLFSKREKQLRALQELRKQDAFREKLNQGNNHSILLQVTGLTSEELEQVLFYCRYSQTYIRSATDYELLMSLLLCFEEYQSIKVREQSGSGNTFDRFVDED